MMTTRCMTLATTVAPARRRPRSLARTARRPADAAGTGARLPRRCRRRQRRSVGAPQPARRHRPDGGGLRARSTTAYRSRSPTISYEKLPIDVTVLLDVSASVTGAALDELRTRSEAAADRLCGGRPAAAAHLQHARAARRRLHRSRRPRPTPRLTSLGGAGSSAVFDSLAVSLAGHDAARPTPADRPLQRRPGQQQHQRRRDAVRRGAAHHADSRRRPARRHRGSAPRRCCGNAEKTGAAQRRRPRRSGRRRNRRLRRRRSRRART